MYKIIFGPFKYLSIKHKQKKYMDWWCPLLLTALSVFILLCLRFISSVSVFSDGGLISKILGFIQGLPGFFIAALAAIATFDKVEMDKIMPAPAPTIDIMVRGQVETIELTRRRFLCMMFAFLTGENLVLVFLAILGQTLAPSLKEIFTESWHSLLAAAYISLFFFLLWQMLLATMWGIYYLGFKVHQPHQ